MIIELPNTNTQEISKALVRIRDLGGQVSTSRVLTLIAQLEATDDINSIVKAASEASREHPSRVIILVHHNHRAPGEPEITGSKVDAEVRIGGDAGASEMIIIHLYGDVAQHQVNVVMPLLLPDTPIVAWWPFKAPVDTAADPIGAIAQRRITDMTAGHSTDALYNRRNNYHPGDSDLAWARLTPWRGVVASALDQPPLAEVTAAKVSGFSDCPSADLAAAWLSARLGIEVQRSSIGQGAIAFDESGLSTIPVATLEFTTTRGSITIAAGEDEQTIEVYAYDHAPALVAVSRRSEADCLAEELRHLDPDVAYAGALRSLDRVQFSVND